MSLESLDQDSICAVLAWLPASSLAQVAKVSRLLRQQAVDEKLWQALLAESFGDARRHPLTGAPELRWSLEESDTPARSIRESASFSARELFARYFQPSGTTTLDAPGTREGLVAACDALGVQLHLSRGIMGRMKSFVQGGRSQATSAGCAVCGNSLRLWGGASRCPCVVARGPRLPLTLLSLDRHRSGSSSLETDTFSDMISTLGSLFCLTVHTTARLEPGSLADLAVDAVFLCTTEGPSIDDDELAELQRFVRGGGTAILSAFANWSRHNHFNRKLSGWLGVQPTEGSNFMPRTTHPIGDSQVEQLRAASCGESNVLRSGVWGSVKEITNTGETEFQISAAEGRSAVALAPVFDEGDDSDDDGDNMPIRSRCTLFPRCVYPPPMLQHYQHQHQQATDQEKESVASKSTPVAKPSGADADEAVTWENLQATSERACSDGSGGGCRYGAGQVLLVSNLHLWASVSRSSTPFGLCHQPFIMFLRGSVPWSTKSRDVCYTQC